VQEALLQHRGEEASSELPQLPAAPPIPAMSTWWRTSTSWLPDTSCSHCLSLSQLICCQQGANLEKGRHPVHLHAAALRTWLWARAQRSLFSALLQGSHPRSLLPTHLKQGTRRLLEVVWSQEMQWVYLSEHTQARCTSLQSAVSFLQPLGKPNIESVEAEEFTIHAEEVRESMSRALDCNIDDVFRTTISGCGALQHAAVEEGAQTCAAQLQRGGGAVAEHASRVSESPKVPVQSSLFAARVPQGPLTEGCYFAQLAGTLRALELAAASGAV